MTCERRVWKLSCGHEEEMDLKCSFQADPTAQDHTHTTTVVESDNGNPACSFCNPPAAPTEQQWYGLRYGLADRQLPPPGSVTSTVRGLDGDPVVALDDVLDRVRNQLVADGVFQNQVYGDDYEHHEVINCPGFGDSEPDTQVAQQNDNLYSQVEASGSSSEGAVQQAVGDGVDMVGDGVDMVVDGVHMVDIRTVPRRRHGGREDGGTESAQALSTESQDDSLEK
ncbi:MAG: hypothetical protein Q9182_006845 [Xanthomendoza sp. 2 TL-2023]